MFVVVGVTQRYLLLNNIDHMIFYTERIYLFHFPMFIIVAYLALLFIVCLGGRHRNILMIGCWRGEFLRGVGIKYMLRRLSDTY